MNKRKNLKIIRKFPVGTPLAYEESEGKIIYGWVTGFSHNPKGDLGVLVNWSHIRGETYLHPGNLRPVDYDFGA